MDPRLTPAEGEMSLADLLLVQLAAIQWASRDLDREFRRVKLDSGGARVTVGDAHRQVTFEPIVYGTSASDLHGQLVEPAGLAAPSLGPAVPVYPEPGADWRHFWAELLQDLGLHAYFLRNSGGTKRYESIELDEQNVASVTVTDATGYLWITRIPLDPPRTDVMGAPFDIGLWISEGQGRSVGDRTKVLDLASS